VSSALFTYVLRLGDNALVLGQRVSEWTGHAPVLEEDLALTNVALDLIGQARLWLAYAGEVEGRGRGEDQLAFFRESRDFRNVLLVEQQNGDFARTMARQFLFDAWHRELLEVLSASRDERLSAIAQKAAREVAYHLRRSSEWVIRLGDGTDESRARMQAALDALWPFTGELFSADEVDADMTARGIGCAPGSLREPWLQRVHDVCTAATLAVPADGWMQSGGKAGRHGEHLSYLLAEMQSVRRSIPGDRW
jgi:ring-1,2-phenylacetyl-CoA epoxidase subunit PaaC